MNASFSLSIGANFYIFSELYSMHIIIFVFMSRSLCVYDVSMISDDNGSFDLGGRTLLLDMIVHMVGFIFGLE